MPDNLVSVSDIKEKVLNPENVKPIKPEAAVIKPTIESKEISQNIKKPLDKVSAELPEVLNLEKKQVSSSPVMVNTEDVKNSERMEALVEANRKDDYIEAEASL